MVPPSCQDDLDWSNFTDLDWSNFTVLLLVVARLSNWLSMGKAMLDHWEFGTSGAILDLPCGKDYLLFFHVLIY
jgi:hypothetical protein